MKTTGVLPLHALRIGLVVCGALVREVQAIAARQGWAYELTAVPAQLHNHPERIAPAVADTLNAWAGRFDLILVGYADCGTQGALDALLTGYEHVERISGPHCYEFFAGGEFHALMETEPGSFFLTDFLARHFDGLVWRGLGLDRYPELVPVYFGNYRRVVYLRQTQDRAETAVYTACAQAAAIRLGLPLELVETGLHTLEARLVEIVTRHAIRLAQAPAPKADAGAR